MSINWTIVSGALDWLWSVANSNFSTALFGAAGGALGAQWIAVRSERRRQLLDKCNALNRAIVTAYSVVNTFVVLKKQHVRTMRERYNQQRIDLESHLEKRRRGELPRDAEFAFIADLESLKLPQVPLAPLEKLLFEKVGITNRPLVELTTLGQVLDSLEAMVRQRDTFIQETKAKNLPAAEFFPLYFGLPDKNRRIDTSYPSCVAMIYAYTDDCIFFSYHLALDLVDAAKALAKTIGKAAPKVPELDFSRPKTEKLIPDDAQYIDWLNMMQEMPRPSSRISKLTQKLRRLRPAT